MNIISYIEIIDRKKTRLTSYIRGSLNSIFFKRCDGIISIGSGCSILGRRNIRCAGNLTIHKRNKIEAIECFLKEKYSPVISFGNNVSMGDDCHIAAINKIEFGDNVLIGSKVLISDHSHGSTDIAMLSIPPKDRVLTSKGPIVIENDVWIGEGVAILSGIRIGKGSIIGANAVVTKDIPSYSTAIGVPAKIINHKK